MAYRAAIRDDIDVDLPDVDRPDVDAEPFGRHEPSPVFSALEEQVILLALHDGLGSLEEPNWFDRLIATLFGPRTRGRALADPRLEALRRAVVVARHRRHLPDIQAVALRDAGFRPDQVRALERRVVGG